MGELGGIAGFGPYSLTMLETDSLEVTDQKS